MPKTDKLDRNVAMLPNGIRIGVDVDSEMLTVDFVGTLGPDGTPKEIIGSYAFSFKGALALSEQLKDAVSHVAKS